MPENLPEEDPQTPGESDEDQLTDSPETRWTWLATGAAGLTILVFLGLVVGNAVGFVMIGLEGLVLYVFLGAVLAAYTYAIGEDVTSILSDIRGK